MTTPGRGPSERAGAPNAFRGAALVFVAVVVGIVGLQILDDSDGGTVATRNGKTSTTTTTANDQQAAPHDPSEVRVKVYNASDVQGAGQALTDRLRAAGYDMQEVGNIVGTRRGTVVYCREGFEGDGVVIAVYGIGNRATSGPFPAEAPDGSDTADCIVILGTN